MSPSHFDSVHYLTNHLSQRLSISLDNWYAYVEDPCNFWGQQIKGQGHMCQNGIIWFCSISS